MSRTGWAKPIYEFDAIAAGLSDEGFKILLDIIVSANRRHAALGTARPPISMFHSPVVPPVRYWWTPSAPTQMCSTPQRAKSQPPTLAAVPATGVRFEGVMGVLC